MLNDNRNYKYLEVGNSFRSEYPKIANIVGGGNVIDLGCGNGSLLDYLRKNKKIERCIGLDISDSGVNATKKKGINAIKRRIDEKLPFKDKEFEYSICNITLQMVMYPEVLLSEMVRVSKKQIITFPNFAFFINRLQMLFFGIMPRFMIPGYKWYSTGHIHQLSIRDFKKYCKDNSISIIKTDHIYPLGLSFIGRIIPNLFATIGVFATKERR